MSPPLAKARIVSAEELGDRAVNLPHPVHRGKAGSPGSPAAVDRDDPHHKTSVSKMSSGMSAETSGYGTSTTSERWRSTQAEQRQ